MLLHYGKITEQQLREAMETHRESGDRLGNVLSARGFVSQADIMYVLRTRTLEIIYDLFIWEEADFEFFDGEPLPMTWVAAGGLSAAVPGAATGDETAAGLLACGEPVD